MKVYWVVAGAVRENERGEKIVSSTGFFVARSSREEAIGAGLLAAKERWPPDPAYHGRGWRDHTVDADEIPTSVIEMIYEYYPPQSPK